MDKMEHFQAVDPETGTVLHELQISDPEAIKPDTAIAFTEADTKSDIESGDNIPTLFGKIKKWFSSLKAVAFSGSYDDLDNKPDLKDVATSGDYNDLDNKPDLKDVATSGDYADLINTPDIFSTTSSGLVPMSTDVEGFLKGDGTWVVPKGGTDQQFLTWEEWEALPDTKYTDNVRYIITDKTYRDGIIQDDKTGDTITWSSNKIVNYISQLPAGFQIPDGWTWTSENLGSEYYTYNRDSCSISLIAGVNGPYIYISQANKGMASVEPNNIEVYGTEYSNYVFRQTHLKADMIKRYDRTSGTGSTDIKYDLKFPDLPNGTTATLATKENTFSINGIINPANTDFNTLTKAGCYKVQSNGAWGNADTYHTPNKYMSSLYSYGLLFVIGPASGDGEHRLSQIYYPHNKAHVIGRMHNGNSDYSQGWTSWMPMSLPYKTATTQTHTGWSNNATDDYIVPTMSFMAFWNGAYNANGNSNLARCNKGAFGNLAVRDTVNKDHISEMQSFAMNGNRYINLTVNTNFGAYTRYSAIVYGIAGGPLYYSLVRISTGSSATSLECGIKNMGDAMSISSASRNSSTGYVTVKLDLGGARWDHMNVIFMNPNNVTCSISVSN